jgi:hypothetical protein
LPKYFKKREPPAWAVFRYFSQLLINAIMIRIGSVQRGAPPLNKSAHSSARKEAQLRSIKRAREAARESPKIKKFRSQLLHSVIQEIKRKKKSGRGASGVGPMSFRYARGVLRAKRGQVFALGFGSIRTPKDMFRYSVWRFANLQFEKAALAA